MFSTIKKYIQKYINQSEYYNRDGYEVFDKYGNMLCLSRLALSEINEPLQEEEYEIKELTEKQKTINANEHILFFKTEKNEIFFLKQIKDKHGNPIKSIDDNEVYQVFHDLYCNSPVYQDFRYEVYEEENSLIETTATFLYINKKQEKEETKYIIPENNTKILLSNTRAKEAFSIRVKRPIRIPQSTEPAIINPIFTPRKIQSSNNPISIWFLIHPILRALYIAFATMEMLLKLTGFFINILTSILFNSVCLFFSQIIIYIDTKTESLKNKNQLFASTLLLFVGYIINIAILPFYTATILLKHTAKLIQKLFNAFASVPAIMTSYYRFNTLWEMIKNSILQFYYCFIVFALFPKIFFETIGDTFACHLRTFDQKIQYKKPATINGIIAKIFYSIAIIFRAIVEVFCKVSFIEERNHQFALLENGLSRYFALIKINIYTILSMIIAVAKDIKLTLTKDSKTISMSTETVDNTIRSSYGKIQTYDGLYDDIEKNQKKSEEYDQKKPEKETEAIKEKTITQDEEKTNINEHKVEEEFPEEQKAEKSKKQKKQSAQDIEATNTKEIDTLQSAASEQINKKVTNEKEKKALIA